MPFRFQCINGCLVWWLTMVHFVAGITLTVSPSNNVEVHQVVTLQCELDPNSVPPILVIFSVKPTTTLCVLEPLNGTCKYSQSSCLSTYNASCSNETVFSIQVNVPQSWNGASICCQTIYATSNYVNFSVKVPVTSVTITPVATTLIDGQVINLICITSYCNPPANITWYKSTTAIHVTNHSTSTRNISDGLVRTTSSLQTQVVKMDNGKQVYCTASNIPGRSINSTVLTLAVLYKPEVTSTISPYIVIEGKTATLECILTDANPSKGIVWKWFKTHSPSIVLYNGPIFKIANIQRDKSGSYNCTANNSVGTSEAVTINVDIQYKPEVTSSIPSPYIVTEGHTASLECRVTAANPSSSIVWRWYKTDNPSNVLHNGSTYTIQHVERNRSGSYNCTAINSVGTSFPANIYLDVQYKPEILDKPSTLVNESEKVIITRTIVSNPLADVYWYRGQQLLQTQLLVNKTTFIIEKASCTDTTNFTLVASNEVERNVTALVELMVNCKPSVANSNVTLGVTDTAVLNFSVIVNAFPEPQYELNYFNGTRNTHMMHTITRNTMNNFSINFNQKSVNECDRGTYHLKIWNLYGETTIIVNIFKQRIPDNPRNIGVKCEGTRAIVQWISSFNGGDHQTFDVFALNGQQRGNQSIRIPDMGENKLHKAYVQNLQPSITYVFYVSAQNNYGFSISDIISCMTSKETTNSQTGTIAGSVAGILLLITIVLIVFLINKRYVCDLTIHKRNSKEANKESSFYTAITEQQENRERNMYDELTKDENRSQYEAVLMTEKQGHNEKLYEEMQKSTSEDFESQSNSKDRKTILKGSVDERCLEQDVEEYANTSFKD